MSFLKPKAPKSSQLSENTNNSLLTGIYTPQAQQGVAANNIIGGALGVPGGDTAGATAGFDQYQQNSGFQNVLQRLVSGITGNQAAGGLLRSGSTSGRILQEGTALNQQSYNNWLQQLQGLSGLGLQGGGIIANTGQRSTGTSTGGGPSIAGSIASAIGGIASIFSDRRLKQNIAKTGEMADGLGVYSFEYLDGSGPFTGVMADEVAALRPWALGPKVGSYATVDYGRL